jgi:uncharacterized membrane protein YdjX (TVP38/TMEM64 family)
LEWIEGLGFWGPLFLVGLYVAFCLLSLPGVILVLAAGFLFGAVEGAVAASLGATLGATASFLVSRTVGKAWVERKLANHPVLLAIDQAIGESGFKIVLLARLALFFPYAATSYAFGLTKVPLGRFVVASWLGRLPAVIVYALVGSTAKSLADLSAGKVHAGIGEQVLLGVTLVAMVLTVAILAQIARRELAAHRRD